MYFTAQKAVNGQLNLYKITVFVFLLFLSLIAVSDRCLCQETPFNPEIDRHMRLGPFRIRPFFAIQNAGYDSNIYRRRTEVVSDFTATLSPGCDIFFNLGHRGTVLLKEQADLVYFIDESSQNHINNRMLAELDLFFNRFSFKGKGSLLYLKERPNNEIDVRTRNTLGNFFLSTVYKYSSKSNASFSFSRRTIRYNSNDEYYGASLSNAFDRDEDSIILNFSQKLFRKTTVALESGFFQYDFQKDFSRDSDAKHYTIGFTFDPEAIISGNLKIGKASFTPNDEKYSEYDGAIGEASLSYRITQSTRMTLLYKKEILFSIYGTNLFYIQNSYGLSIFQYLTRRLGFELGATFYRSRYTVPEYIPLPEGGSIYDYRRDDVKTGFAGLKYKLSDNYNVGLRISRWVRDSNLYTQDVDETMIGTTFGYQF